MFKDYLKQTRAYPLLRLLKSYFEAVLWFFGSKQGVSPPALFKRAVIKQYAKKFSPSIFIETGTYLGDTVAAVKNLFSEIHSIELGENLAKEARKRFAKYSHIKIHQGDSAIVLPEIFKIDAAQGIYKILILLSVNLILTMITVRIYPRAY